MFLERPPYFYVCVFHPYVLDADVMRRNCGSKEGLFLFFSEFDTRRSMCVYAILIVLKCFLLLHSQLFSMSLCFFDQFPTMPHSFQLCKGKSKLLFHVQVTYQYR